MNDIERVQDIFGVSETVAKEMLTRSVDVDRSEGEIQDVVSDKFSFDPDPEYIFVYKCEDCEKEVAQYLGDPYWAGNMFCVCGGVMRFDQLKNLELLRNTVEKGDEDD